MKLIHTCTILLALLTPVLSTAAQQQISDTRATIAGTSTSAVDTNAAFAVGLVRIQDTAFRSDAYADDTITIAANIRAEAAHVGQPADVFVVVVIGNATYMLNTSGGLVPWNGSIAGLTPMVDDVVLQSSHEVTIFSGVIGGALDLQMFVGYKPSSSSTLYYTPAPQLLKIKPTPLPVAQCSTYGGRTVPVWHTSSTGIFTHAPFAASTLNLITNGVETNDPRFSYQWVKNISTGVPIYAPADGVLIRIRHKAENLPEFPSDDYDLFFLTSCDPQRPGELNSVVRFNHITNPRADIKAAFAYGSLGAPTFKPVFDEHEERQVPTTNIVVRAGDYLGYTTGTPTAHNFDFQIAINEATVCPFSVLEAPHSTTLGSMLGPISASPAGPPVSGYACAGYGMRP